MCLRRGECKDLLNDCLRHITFERVDKDPSLVQIVCVDDDSQMTLGELDQLANQISHWARNKGLKKG